MSQLSVILKAIDEMSPVIQAAAQKADKALSSMESKLKSSGRAMTNAGQKMTMSVTAPLVATGVAALKMSADFDTAFRSVNVMLGATADEAARYKDRILDISDATGKAAADVTAAYYQIVSAGYRGADSLDILETAMRGATGGAADATATTAALVKAMNIFQLEGVKGSTMAMDTFFGIVDSGLLSFEELAHAFPRAASNAAGLGISIQETGATLATLTKVLGSTEQAATATDAIFRTLISPSEALKALYDEWGVSSGPEAIKQFGSLSSVLERLMQETGGNVVAIRELFASDEAMRGILPLLTSSSDDFAAALETVTGAAGRTGEAFDEMAGGPGFQLQQAATQIKNALIELGDALSDTIVPLVTDTAGAVTKAVHAFSGLPEPVRRGAIVVGLLAAAMGPLLMSMGFIATGLGTTIGLYRSATAAMITHRTAMVATTTAAQGATASTLALNVAMRANPIGLVITAIGLVITGLIALHNNWDWVVSHFKRGVSESERAFNEWSDSIRDSSAEMLSSVEMAYDQMVASATSSAEQEIQAASYARDMEKQTLEERAQFYRDFTQDKLGQIDKQMVAELAAIDGALGEQAQAYLDLLGEQESEDKKREDEIERRRIRDLRRQLETDEDLTKQRRLEIEDRIADYEAQQEREKISQELFNAIKEADTEQYFDDQKGIADQAFTEQEALILQQTADELAEYQTRLDAFKQLHVDELVDTVAFVNAYNEIMAGSGGKAIEIPEFPEAPTPSVAANHRPRITGGGLLGMAGGGDITEPTLLYGLRSQRPYAIAGESGIEHVVPHGDFVGGGIHIENFMPMAQVVIREEADIAKLRETVARELYKLRSVKGQYA